VTSALASTASLAFVALALWHFRLALRPTTAMSASVPSIAGKPLFTPSVAATVAVGLVLLLCACLVAATAGLVKVGVPARVLSWLSYGLAAGLLARAVGEFRYVGFFKSVRDSRFAKLDTVLYSPLCLLLALSVALVARQNGV
jgi:hypothetical protein